MSLIEVLKSASDFRSSHGKRHELWFVLLLIIVGAACGYWGYRPAAEFAKRYGEEVCDFLSIPKPKTMASYSTFRRVLLGLDLIAFAELFNRWAADYVDIEPDEWLSSDGKSIRGSVTDYNSSEQDFISLVSLFSQKRGQVVCALPFHNKQMGEEYAVRQMLAAIDLRGAVVTTDALHTKKTVETIRTHGGHYLMCVKRNQKTLYDGIANQMRQSPIDLCFSSERGHSRHEHRLVMAYEPDNTWQDRWPGISRILGVYRCGQRNHQPYAECHYYISDLSLETEQFAQLIRGHWSIENTLHWPKDVVLGEDTARQRAGNSPANWSLVRNFFINLARHYGFASMAKAKRFFANQPRDVLLALT